MRLEKKDIEKLDRHYRLNLINSVPGVKPANLVGTRSLNKEDNLAIISSVVHLSSNPAHLGLVMRPPGKRPKDTYINILETGSYTINHVPEDIYKQAHYTSAKLERELSEFDVMNIEREFLKGFHAPFVRKSPVKIGMKHLENIPLPNGCIFVVGEVALIDFPEASTNAQGQIDLSSYDCVGISGLNTYYSLKKIDTLPYVRTNEIPNFDE
jgi:flavin reductase (DIM6/NTAB) family NADH-FMN oxidoreductase RutF